MKFHLSETPQKNLHAAITSAVIYGKLAGGIFQDKLLRETKYIKQKISRICFAKQLTSELTIRA